MIVAGLVTQDWNRTGSRHAVGEEWRQSRGEVSDRDMDKICTNIEISVRPFGAQGCCTGCLTWRLRRYLALAMSQSIWPGVGRLAIPAIGPKSYQSMIVSCGETLMDLLIHRTEFSCREIFLNGDESWTERKRGGRQGGEDRGCDALI